MHTKDFKSEGSEKKYTWRADSSVGWATPPGFPFVSKRGGTEKEKAGNSYGLRPMRKII